MGAPPGRVPTGAGNRGNEAIVNVGCLRTAVKSGTFILVVSEFVALKVGNGWMGTAGSEGCTIEGFQAGNTLCGPDPARDGGQDVVVWIWGTVKVREEAPEKEGCPMEEDPELKMGSPIRKLLGPVCILELPGF
jgi:hypothetical protein